METETTAAFVTFNTTLSTRPKMFDSVARPYVLAYGDKFAKLDSCGVGGPNAQTAEAEKILMCNPDIVISEYEDKEKEDALNLYQNLIFINSEFKIFAYALRQSELIIDITLLLHYFVH